MSVRRQWSIVQNAETARQRAFGSFSDWLIVRNLDECHSRISISASGKYPFTPQALTPSIDYRATWDLRVVGKGLVRVRLVEGGHNRFPDYEALLKGPGGVTLQYKYAADDDGPGFVNLTSWVIFGDRWEAWTGHSDLDTIPKLVGNVPTPPCCPNVP
jgi:hypothetical protein